MGVMLVSIVISYGGGILIQGFMERGKQKAGRTALILSAAASLALLLYFKYAAFLMETVNHLLGTEFPSPQGTLPIGISFYTFQMLSYLMDVYHGTVKAQRDLVSFGTYVTMFPQLIAGPIVQYKTIQTQLAMRRENAEQFAQGVRRFVTGLGKKVLIANNAGALWNTIQAFPAAQVPVLTAWMGLLAFTFQIYFDFSAYSDMAIGLGHMFGFKLPENFRAPYTAASITEFWRRWHISLGTWFREYVYIPLGGNRVNRCLHVRNILIVWLLTGIWHGASWNFVVWGLYYGILLLAEKYWLGRFLKRWPSAFLHLYCMFFVMIGWNLFAFTDLGSGLEFMKSLFGIHGQELFNRETIYLFYNHAVLLGLCAAGSTNLLKAVEEKICGALAGQDILQTAIENVFYLGVLFLSVAWLVDASFNPFLYFRF